MGEISKSKGSREIVFRDIVSRQRLEAQEELRVPEISSAAVCAV
jgi:hypothetical protein